MKRPVEEVARAIYEHLHQPNSHGWPKTQPVTKLFYSAIAIAVLNTLSQLGFLNDNYFVAKKAEEAGDDVRKPQ